MIDASIVRVHQYGAGAKGGSTFKTIGRSRGGSTSKIRAVVDALGNPLQFEVTGGNINDCVVGYEILQLSRKLKAFLEKRFVSSSK